MLDKCHSCSIVTLFAERDVWEVAKAIGGEIVNENSKIMDFMCRFCLKSDAVDNIFDDPLLKARIAEYIKVELSTASNLPKMICKFCIDKVNSIEEFIEQIKNVQNELKHLFAPVVEDTDVADNVKQQETKNMRNFGSDVIKSVKQLCSTPNKIQTHGDKITYNIYKNKFDKKYQKKSDGLQLSDTILRKLLTTTNKFPEPRNTNEPTVNPVIVRNGSPSTVDINNSTKNNIPESKNTDKFITTLVIDCDNNVVNIESLPKNNIPEPTSANNFITTLAIDCDDDIVNVDSLPKNNLPNLTNNDKSVQSPTIDYNNDIVNIDSDSDDDEGVVNSVTQNNKDDQNSSNIRNLSTDILNLLNNSTVTNGTNAKENPSTLKRKLEEWKCIVCGSDQSSKFELLKHYKKHFADLEKNPNVKIIKSAIDIAYQCNKCFKVFLSSKSTYSHLLNDHNEEFIAQLRCKYCGKGFSTPNSIMDHNYHNCSKLLYCKYIPCLFKTCDSNKLENHLKSHMPKYKFNCDVCNKMCLTLSSLRAHKSIHTTKEPNPAINLEGLKNNISENTIRTNTQSIESNGTNANCSKNNAVLRCKFCKKEFTLLNHLNSHMLNSHNISYL